MTRWRRALRGLDQDIRDHIEQEIQDNIARGMSPEEARHAALRAFGNVTLIKEDTRAVWISTWFDQIVQDAWFALRLLRKNVGFTAAAITMLALGIGLNTAVFTISNAVLFNGFRLIDRNDRILYIHSEKKGQYSGVSYPDFQNWRAQARSFDGMGTVEDLRITLNDQNGFPERYTATRITANGFRLLGQQPILGRDFTASDEIPGAAPVAILTYRFWERRYGKDRAIIGKTLQIHGAPPTTVIGIMPEGFSFPQNQDLWLPLVPAPDLQRRDARNLWFAFGRIADGVTREKARAELETIGRQLASAYPQTNKGRGIEAQTFAEFFIGPNATVIYGAMWGAVGFVFLIACANLANLLLAHTMGRSREISVRMALGAGRWRIIRQLMIESLMLSIIGGAGGWVVARWGVRTYELATNPPVGEWRRDLLKYTMDYRVLAYLMAISIGAAFLFGLAPAFRFSRRLDLNTVLKDGCRGGTGGGSRRHLSSLLLIGEVALAVVLLAGAGVMIHGFLNIYTADVGARIGEIRTMLLHLPESKYARREASLSFFYDLKTRLEAIPGVESTSIGLSPAGGIPPRRPYELADGGTYDEQGRPAVTTVTVGPDYFRTLGATVLSGREFNTFDGVSRSPAAIVNQQFATQHWPGKNALGERLRIFDGETPEAWLTVIGVVSNIVYDPTRQEITPVVYLPYGQGQREGDMWVLIRTPIPAAGLVATFRREISALEPDALIWLGPYDLADRLAAGGVYGNIRNHTVLFLIFAAIALLLASTGLYAVTAHSVSQRTQEIGVRMAIGATAHDILILVLREGMLPSAIGLIMGLAASLAVNRILRAELVHVSLTDPMTYVGVSIVLIVSATLGCWIPARRAMQVDPAVAIRHE